MGRIKLCDETGAGALEMAIAAPATLVLLVAVLQGALWWHADHVALAAAQQGVTVAASEGPAAGQSAAAGFAVSAGLHHPAIAVTGGPVITVTVTAHAPGLIPGFDPAVHAQASAPTETYETP
jgi:hypothetical protein